VLLNENAKIHHSCIWFSLIGAAILDQYYQLKPKVFMGIAAYMVNGTSQSVLTFAEKAGDRFISSEGGFHSWIEVDDVIIDFTSPLFPTMMKTPDDKPLCESKIFQRSIETMVNSPRELAATGDFFMLGDAKLTDNLVDDFVSVPANMDILNICCSWYRRPPSEMQQMIGISDGTDAIRPLYLQRFEISGAW
jgi:hypothetical protein